MAEGIPLGPYLLVRRLAHGGMAEIFLARREGPEGFSRDLVVKRILPHLGADAEFVEMFLEEARVAARLAHPNVVHVYDFGEVNGQYYLAMELVRGVDLSALILRASELARAEGRVGALPVHHAAKIISFVCEGLAHAHGLHGPQGLQRLVHRDVTPANVLISFDGAVKVADFGIAKAEQGVHIERTRQGIVKGKRTYLSPEQSRGERLDARSDLFNVGILLYEAVTGVPLFPADGHRQAMKELVNGQLPGERWLADVPDALAQTIRRALAPDPDDRHVDALALRSELEAFLRTWTEPSDAVEIGVYVRQVFADVVAADRLAPRAAGTVPLLTAQGPNVSSFSAREAPPAAIAPRPPRGPTMRMDAASSPAIEDVHSSELALTAVNDLPHAIDEDETEPPTKRAHPQAHSSVSIPPGPPATRLWLLIAAFGVALFAGAGVLTWLSLSADTSQITLQPVPPRPVPPRPALPTTPLAPPPHTELPPPSSARVRVSSTPAGAQVEIDGVAAGLTPLEANVAPGTHIVALSLEGYNDDQSTVELGGPGETGVLVFSLRRAARIGRGRPHVAVTSAQHSGTLTISTSPWSRVYLGARLLGTTPLANVTLPAGRQSLTLRAPGRPEKRIVVTISPDGETRVREVL